MACARHAARAVAFTVAALLVAAAAVTPEEATSPVVVARVLAGWNASRGDELAEASEFVAGESDASFWGFADAAFARLTASPPASDLECALAVAEPLLSPLDRRLLKLSLAVRAFAPAVELHRQLASAHVGEGAAAPCVATGEAFAVVHGTVACTVADVSAALAAGVDGEPTVYEFDHVRAAPTSPPGTPVVILYGTMGDAASLSWYEAMTRLTAAGDVRFVWRHVRRAAAAARPVVLQGYGCELDIKNMEYKALDDRPPGGTGASAAGRATMGAAARVAGIDFDTLRRRRPEHSDALDALRKGLEKDAAVAPVDDVKVWDMKDLGMQAVGHVIGGDGNGTAMLRRLTEMSGNFPSFARWLAKTIVPDSLKDELRSNARFMEPGAAVVLVNGIPIDTSPTTFNLFSLLNVLRREAQLVTELGALRAPEYVREAARHVVGAPSRSEGAFRVDVRTGSRGVVTFLNNLEADKAYARWPKTLQGLLVQSWQLHMIRRNLYHVVLFLDPASLDGMTALAIVQYYIRAMTPIRFGIVLTSPEVQSDASDWRTPPHHASAPLAGYHVSLLYNRALEHSEDAAKGFLQTLLVHANAVVNQGQMMPPRGDMTVEDAMSAYAEAVKEATSSWTQKKARAEATAALSDADGAGAAVLRRTAQFINRRALKVPSISVNGIITRGLDMQGMLPIVYQELGRLQQMVATGMLSDGTSIYQMLMKGDDVVPLYNAEVLEGHGKFVSLTSPAGIAFLKQLRFAPGTGDGVVGVSLTHVDDFSTRRAFAQLAVVLRVAGAASQSDDEPDTETRARVRVAVASASDCIDGQVAAAFLSWWNTVVEHAAGSAVGLAEQVATTLARGGGSGDASGGLSYDELRRVIAEAAPAVAIQSGEEAWLREQVSVTAAAFAQHLRGGAVKSMLVANGRVLVLQDGALFSEGDTELLILHEFRWRGRALVGFAAAVDDPDTFVAQAAALCGVYGTVSREKVATEHLACEHSCIHARSLVPSGLSVVAVLDPASPKGMRMAPLLVMLHEALGADVDLYLMPALDVSEMPIKSYYRFVEPVLAGAESPAAVFENLPTQHILTMKMQVPEPWDVQAAVAAYDLDNLRLGATGTAPIVTADYVLKAILVGGQCNDLTSSQPPNGLQLRLERDVTGANNADTLVMQNLGYFQLKANPGVWQLQLAEGRGAELYNIVVSADADDGPGGLQWMGRRTAGDSAELVRSTKQIAVKDFTGPIAQLRVRKIPGKEEVALLEKLGAGSQADAPSTGIWSRVTEILNSGGSRDADRSNQTIHVFSLASGHLYERFLKIMLLSVVKRATRPVKFWLIENFLSPAFKDFLPKFSAMYHFDVALVSYKWPNWLRQQTEKQRIIWGYKILFLDVLFPLELEKVIYVDADQVVRADLSELMDMDLQGKPYAYTPFCTSREETLGFQFWRQGYWKEHLRDLPYHISALYVVDLAAFRRGAVGDQLRSIYDQLSRDPNSLANLDQDLPNYAQHAVPIFSLPQEWLWCESWCSDDSKKTSKTIDLCNNPLHKEPKLDMARRVINGPLFPQSWVQLDNEVAAAEAESSPIGV